jgi:ssDNA-binding Zn-finger/Zn-ribbon topoisomerase 1
MTKRGTHTWDIVVDYHSCPKCNHIIENREKYILRNNQLEKDLTCPKCGHQWTETKKKPPFTFFNTWKAEGV